VYNGVTSLLDFAPTILDLCGVPIPEGPRPVKPIVPKEGPPWPGHSLRPVLEGSGDNVRSSAFVDHDDDFAGLRVRTLVTRRHRITCYAGQPYGELFDLQEDPQELRNLWSDPGYRSLRYELTAHLLDEVSLHESRFPRKLAGA
jgi:arylsulfatase A-like enzyme